MLGDLRKDALELHKVLARLERNPPSLVKMVLAYDSFAVTLLTRLRELARRARVLVGVNRTLRIVQMTFYGIEISRDVKLGHGVYFAYPVGVVLAGTAQVGDRVCFLGGNTVGTSDRDDGYPILEEDVVLNPGARILGPVRVGARSVIGANAVVVEDVPPDSRVTGNPGRVSPR